MSEMIVLVDVNDNETGIMPKLAAHEQGLLHRAFSVFVFNTAGELLLQQRALDKYHSAGLWTNTCCSHPRPGEDVMDAAHRRLNEEMGLECHLTEVFSFVYKAGMENNLTEYEFDHVFTGVTDTVPVINESEVAAWKFVSKAKLLADMESFPGNYTEWFKICIKERLAELFN